MESSVFKKGVVFVVTAVSVFALALLVDVMTRPQTSSASSFSIVPYDGVTYLEGSEYDETYHTISLDEFKQKQANKESFLILIYNPGCTACNESKPVINNFIKENHLKMYGFNTFTGSIGPYINYEYTPTIALIHEGDVVDLIDYTNNHSNFVSSTNMTNYYKDKIEVSKLRQISSEENLDKLIQEKQESIVYFHYSLCGDCVFFDNRYFNDFMKNTDKIIYSYEMATYFENDELWNGFVLKYGLSKTSENNFGYKNGVVPMFLRYKDSKVDSSAVIYNDTFEKILAENDEVEGVKVVSSFYDDAPFINQVYYRTENETAMNVYRDATFEFYKEKLLSFLG